MVKVVLFYLFFFFFVAELLSLFSSGPGRGLAEFVSTWLVGLRTGRMRDNNSCSVELEDEKYWGGGGNI